LAELKRSDSSLQRQRITEAEEKKKSNELFLKTLNEQLKTFQAQKVARATLDAKREELAKNEKAFSLYDMICLFVVMMM